jgi:hypothetical protein
MSEHIPIYGLPWHLNQSPAIREFIISPLSQFMHFEQIGWDGDGDLPGYKEEWLRNKPIIFFQKRPPECICNHSYARIIWVPMWDDVYGYDLKWWNRLPKNLRVVSFSYQISMRARAVGLNTLDVRYFISPNNVKQVVWSKPLTLLYWNRTGMVGETFLHKLCQSLDVDILLFWRRIDPRISSACDYKLPKMLGKTIVMENGFGLEGSVANQEYWKYLDKANIYIAPRLSEGVGLSFIEAMAKGCAVFAHDAPTMSEYITHKTNGYLFPRRTFFGINSGQKNIINQINRISRFLLHNDPYPITEWQNWAEIENLDLRAMGTKARQDQLDGFEVWKNILPKYASFILDWG